LQKSAILRRMSLLDRPAPAADQHVRLDPICISSRTECCVGFVFSSPAAAMYGSSVRWHEERVLAPHLLRYWRIASRKGQALDVAHRAADLGDHHVVVGRQAADGALMASVMCGITCTVAPRYSPRRSRVMTSW
jgi:hypothetical protein